MTGSPPCSSVADPATRTGASGRLRLGCPVWACADWRGSLYTEGARREQWLGQYAEVFGAVEGSASFYALPPDDTVRRWATEAPASLRICFKVPKAISHEAQLRDVAPALSEFLARMSPLGERLGPFLLQLGPRFAPEHLPDLAATLPRFPREFDVAVEVRHPGWYRDPESEARLDELLRRHRCERALFDTRVIHAVSPAEAAADPTTAEARRKKPVLPLRTQALGRQPFLRFVGLNRVDAADPQLRDWAQRIAGWLREGRDPYVFTHTPDDRHAPALAARLHGFLREALPELPPLPVFPGRRERRPAQADLFG